MAGRKTCDQYWLQVEGSDIIIDKYKESLRMFWNRLEANSLFLQNRIENTSSTTYWATVVERVAWLALGGGRLGQQRRCIISRICTTLARVKKEQNSSHIKALLQFKLFFNSHEWCSVRFCVLFWQIQVSIKMCVDQNMYAARSVAPGVTVPYGSGQPH